MASERKLDVFQLLAKLDRRDMSIWSTLDDDQRKEFAPLVVMRWLAGTGDSDQIMALNEFVNTKVFALANHKELLMKLMAASDNGRSKRYQWMPMKQRATKVPFTLRLMGEMYPLMSKQRLESKVVEFGNFYTKEELINAAETRGWQKDEITSLKKELKNRE